MVETKTMTEWNGVAQKVLQNLHEDSTLLLDCFNETCKTIYAEHSVYCLLSYPTNFSDRTMLHITSSKTWITTSVRTHVGNSHLPGTQFRQKWIGICVSQLQELTALTVLLSVHQACKRF